MHQTKDSFSIVIIPDTQDLCTFHPEKLKDMVQWVVDHSNEMNIKKIIHVGDVVNNGALREEQFKNHHDAFSLINEAEIPLTIAIGNHDYDNLLSENRNSTMFNKYCGVDQYEDKPWFGGVFETDKAENMYTKLKINGDDFLFLSLEFGPRDDALKWADQVLSDHADHKAIIVTHSYMYLHGERTKPGDNHNPKDYVGAHGANDGEDVWNKCFKRHANIMAIFSGHHIEDNISYRFDTGVNGNIVFQSFQNWQCAPDGGDGRIRILSFNTNENKIDLSVYNPQTGRYETEHGHSVSYPYLPSEEERHELLKERYPEGN